MESMELLYTLIALSILLILTVIGFVLYAGLLDPVNVGAGKPPVQKITIAYKYGRGPYRDSGYVFSESSSIAPTYRCIGLYYDDPKQVPAEKLRWAAGKILSEGDDLPDQDIVDLFLSKGFHLFFLPSVTNAVRTTFPYRTSLSIFIGIFKVYPILGEYIKINRLCAYPFIEIYEDDLIHYMAPLAKQEEFFVHEAVLHGLQPEDAEDPNISPLPEEALDSTSEGVPCSSAAGDGQLPDIELQGDINDVNGPDIHDMPRDSVDASGDHETPSLLSEEVPSENKNVHREMKTNPMRKDRSTSRCSAQSSNGDDKENQDANIIKGAKASTQSTLEARGMCSTSLPEKTVNPESAAPSERPQRTGLGCLSHSVLHQMPPSPALSTLSESSVLSTSTEGSSVASFYSSQSELSYTSGSKTEFSDSDLDTEKEGCSLDDSQSGGDRSL